MLCNFMVTSPLVPCVYDITICYRDGKDPTLMDVVNAESARADMLIRRYPMEEIDTSSEEAISKWLMNLFVEKVLFWFFKLIKISMYLRGSG